MSCKTCGHEQVDHKDGIGACSHVTHTPPGYPFVCGCQQYVEHDTLRQNKGVDVPRLSRIMGRGIDPGIADEVRILQENGVETFESCQGGQGHPFPEPTVRFHGGQSEGPRALGIALANGLRVIALKRVWCVIDGEMTGPQWEMTFHHPDGGGAKAVSNKNGTVTWEWK